MKKLPNKYYNFPPVNSKTRNMGSQVNEVNLSFTFCVISVILSDLMGQLPGRLILCLHVDVARRRPIDVDVTTSTSAPKSTVPKLHKIALDNTKGER